MAQNAKSNADAEAALKRRCIDVIEALSAALKERGHRIDQNAAVVHDEHIPFYVFEPRRQTRVPLNRSDFGYQSGATQQVLIPSGRLTLVAEHTAGSSGGRRWADRPGRPLERQISKIAADFEALARRMKDNRARRERIDREVEDMFRQAAQRYRWDIEAKERPGRFRTMTADWREAQQMTAFLGALESHVGPQPSASLATWIEWARSYVADLDPFSPTRMEELEEHAAILATPKVGKPEPEESEWRHIGLLDDYL